MALGPDMMSHHNRYIILKLDLQLTLSLLYRLSAQRHAKLHQVPFLTSQVWPKPRFKEDTQTIRPPNYWLRTKELIKHSNDHTFWSWYHHATFVTRECWQLVLYPVFHHAWLGQSVKKTTSFESYMLLEHIMHDKL